MPDYSGLGAHHHKHQHHVPGREYQLPNAIGGWTPSQTTEFIRSLLANDPTMLPGSLKLNSLSVENFDGSVRGDQVDTTTLALTDGVAPASSPTPTVTGGLGLLAVKWVAITNADSVGYQVHISTSSGFTPDATTLSQKIVGTLAFIRVMPDGTALNYATTYYVKLVAFDDDGLAPAGAQATGSPTQVGTADIVTGSVTAELLEASLVLSTTIIAGAQGGARVELGIDPNDSSATGLRAFDSSNAETFNIDAQDGSVYAKGRIDFGTGSRLLSNDIVELEAQPTSGFQTPAHVQRANVANLNPSVDITTINCTWPAPTTKGNLLLAVVTQRNSGGGSTPGTPTMSGWTQIQTATVGSGPIMRQTIFKIENAASRSGAQAVGLVSATRYVEVQMFEYSGTGVQDILATAATGTSTSPATNTTGTLGQAGELLFAAIGSNGEGGNSPTNSFVGYGGASAGDTGGSPPVFTAASSQGTYELITTSTSSTSTGVTLDSSRLWIAQLVTFKAKTATTAVDTPDTDKLRFYSGRDAASSPTPHVVNDDGTANSVAMAPSGAGWRLEYVTANIDWPSTAAHSTATNQTPTISGLNVGDLCFIIGRAAGGGFIIAMTDPVCTVANQITVKGFNADSVTQDPTSQTYHFLVIHIT